MQIKPWRTVLFSGLFVLVVLTLSIYSQLEFPAPNGSYTVGRTTFKWVDASRPEVLTQDPGDLREVIATVWYPAESGTGAQAGYFPNLLHLSEALVQSGELKWWQVFGLRFVRSENRLDAVPVKSAAQFPVVILSPGNGTNIELYSSLASEIASHGYIVLGLNHPYDVPAVQLAGGEIAPYAKNQWLLSPETHQAYISERIKVRTGDVIFALEQLDAENAAGPFAGTMDLDSVAAAGHSLGGLTASETCKADARFKACMNLDGLQKGGPFSMDRSAIPPEQPFLFLTKESQLHPTLLERFESMPESYWVAIHGASHQSFTDGPSLEPSFLPGPKEADRFMDLIQRYSLAFLDHTLKGTSSELLSQSIEKADVSVQVFPSG